MSDGDAGPDLSAGIDPASLPDNGLLGGTVGGEAVVLVARAGGHRAWSGKCTHLAAPLADGLIVDGQLRCPWHHARFSLETGCAIAAPAFAPLVRYDVAERDGRLFVTGPSTVVDGATDRTGTIGQVVIVGGGAAGFACAELLTRGGFGDAVTLVGDDPDPPYDRTFCSKHYLIGMVERDDCDLAGKRRLTTGPGPTLSFGRTVSSIDRAGKRVVLDDGTAIPYDTLVLATGAKPQRPDLPGLDRPEVHLLRTLANADAIIASSKRGKRAVVVGASFIGLEAAASLTQRDVAVHVVAPDDVPLEKVVGREVGTMIRAVHEEKGVVFHLGRTVKRFDGALLTLDDDSTIPADFVVLGVGVKPRDELAEAAGLDVAPADDGGGVIVDAQLRTSSPDIHAIGDIARYPDRHTGTRIRVEHWVHAQRQGQFVARLLMGQAERFDDLPFFWSAHFDTGLRYHGHVGKIVASEVDGSIDGRDFQMTLAGEGRERAFVTCNRDMPALEVEAQWESEAK